jgi:hypothetical protein
MPNIPQMGKFWISMRVALEISRNGGATPQVALQDAFKSMQKAGCKSGAPPFMKTNLRLEIKTLIPHRLLEIPHHPGHAFF